MENILRVIVEADRAARAEVDAAKKRREAMTSELSVCKQQIDETYRENAEKAIEKVHSNMELKVARAADAFAEKTAAISDRLRQLQRENEDAWVQTIVNSVING